MRGNLNLDMKLSKTLWATATGVDFPPLRWPIFAIAPPKSSSLYAQHVEGRLPLSHKCCHMWNIGFILQNCGSVVWDSIATYNSKTFWSVAWEHQWRMLQPTNTDSISANGQLPLSLLILWDQRRPNIDLLVPSPMRSNPWFHQLGLEV